MKINTPMRNAIERELELAKAEGRDHILRDLIEKWEASRGNYDDVGLILKAFLELSDRNAAAEREAEKQQKLEFIRAMAEAQIKEGTFLPEKMARAECKRRDIERKARIHAWFVGDARPAAENHGNTGWQQIENVEDLGFDI